MLSYIVRRLVQTLITLFLVSVIVYFITMMLPGNPVMALIGPEGASEEVIEHYRTKLGLDKPIYLQYFYWLKSFLQGELGTSIRNRVNVMTLFAQRFPVTLQLIVMGVVFALLIAIPVGIISSIKPNSWFDAAGTLIAVSGVSIPRFLSGMIMILVFSIWLDWLPSAGYVSPFDSFWGSLRSLLMPAIALGGMLSAELMRQLRSGLLEVLQTEYVTTARSKGLPEWAVILKHATRNALIPVVTMLGMRIGRLIGGVVVVELVFSLSGIGRLLMNAILFQDYPVLQTGLVMVAFSVTIMNLLADISYSFLDPRVRYD